MPPVVKTSISGISSEAAPGGIIQGTVELESAEPLSLTALSVTLHGRASSRIFRELSIAILPLHGKWKGQAKLCERRLTLVDGLTTLPAGQHKFPFRLRVPATTEVPAETAAERGRKKEWQQVSPFVGFQTSHPLPPTVSANSEQGHVFLHGDASAIIEYELKVLGKANSQDKQWDLRPHTQQIKMAGPAEKWAEDIKPRDLGLSLGGKHHDVTVSVQMPGKVTQWEPLPIQLKVDGAGFELVSLKAKVYTRYMVRARSSFLKENASPVISEEKLLVWEGEKPLSPGEPQLIESEPVSGTAAVVKFATLNVACTVHELEVKFKLRDGKGKVFPGVIGPFPIDIQGPNPSMAGDGEESPRASVSVL